MFECAHSPFVLMSTLEAAQSGEKVESSYTSAHHCPEHFLFLYSSLSICMLLQITTCNAQESLRGCGGTVTIYVVRARPVPAQTC